MIKMQRDENGLIISECSNCIFATWERDKPWHGKQLGCLFNRIEKFKKRGSLVEYNETDDCDSYTVHGFCNAIRDNEWAKEQGEGLTNEELMEVVDADNVVQYTAIITEMEANCTETAIANVKHSIEGVIQQDILPKRIIISTYGTTIDVPELVLTIKDWYNELYVGEDVKIPLYFNKCLVNEYDRHIIDNSMSKVETNYYVAIRSGFFLLSDKIGNLNRRINTECEHVAIVTDSNENVYISSVGLHKALAGHKEYKLEEKLIGLDENHASTVLEFAAL